jgi:hypothetical protein
VQLTNVRVDSARLTYVPMPIGEHFNNRAISPAQESGAGRFNVWGNSFPAGQLPAPGNIRCDGQLIAPPRGRYDWLHLLAAAERRAEDGVALHFTDGEVDFEALRVSDFWAAPARFGEHLAFMTSQMNYPHHVQSGLSALMWRQRVPVTRGQPLTGIRLPRNVAIHVFALTLQSALDHEPAQARP